MNAETPCSYLNVSYNQEGNLGKMAGHVVKLDLMNRISRKSQDYVKLGLICEVLVGS